MQVSQQQRLIQEMMRQHRGQKMPPPAFLVQQMIRHQGVSAACFSNSSTSCIFVDEASALWGALRGGAGKSLIMKKMISDM